MSYVPNIYPNGGPLRWQDDQTGTMPAAVNAFFKASEQSGELSEQQIELVRDYCQYYINAPGWNVEGLEQEFADLRERVKSLNTIEDIHAWLDDALMNIGIDPF